MSAETGMSPEEAVLALEADGRLELDSEGRIWRLAELRGGAWVAVERRRAERQSTHGYLQVRVIVDGRRLHVGAHRIVCWRAHGPVAAGLVVNHINGRKDDNRPENLEAITYGGNTSHAHRTGLIDQRGARNPGAKLTDDQVRSIRERRAAGEALAAIASDFGITFQSVSRIAKGSTRTDAGGPLTLGDGRAVLTHSRGSDGRFDGAAAGRLLDGVQHDGVPAEHVPALRALLPEGA